MILFDCERMVYPNTGFYYFCDQLANELQKQADYNPEYELQFYVPQNIIGRWGNKCSYEKANKFHEWFFYNPKVELWHSTCQFTKYMPRFTKIVQTIHDLNYLHEPTSAGRMKRKAKRIGNNLKRVSAVVAISEWTKRDILNNFDTKDIPIEVVYNGCNVYHGPVNEPSLKPKRPFLFTVSAMYPKKNVHVLPCLLKDNDYELIISGIHPYPEYITRIREEAKLWNVSDRVHFTGAISESEKHWYLKHCTAFLFPSLAEGFGLPPIEAMQYGKPVFLSPRTCLPEIGGKHAYYFNPDFERNEMRKEFQEGLDHFYNGYNNPEEIKAHARGFSWENAAKQYWNIYRTVLSR